MESRTNKNKITGYNMSTKFNFEKLKNSILIQFRDTKAKLVPLITKTLLLDEKCSYCGGRLVETILDIDKYIKYKLGPLPKIKNRRKRKLHLIKYKRKLKRIRMTAHLISPLYHKVSCNCY